MFNAGSIASLTYDGADVGGSFIKRADFQFHNATGQNFTLRDYDDDGVATLRLDSTQSAGTYTLSNITLRDGRASENSITLNNQGGTDSFGGDGTHVRDTHSFDYSTYTIEVTAPTGGSLSDSVDPTLSAVTVVTDTVNFGEIASVNYVGDGTGSGLDDVVVRFRHESSGESIMLQDIDGDGNATGHLNQGHLVSGSYEFDGGWVVDEGNNRLALNSSDFDGSITFVVPSNINDAQTDFDVPILDDFSFLPDIA